MRPDEDANGAFACEAVHEVLRERAVDLGCRVRRPLAAVAPWVVDVDVEPVLMRDVARAEITASREAEISDAEARGAGVRSRIAVDDAEDRRDEPVGPVPAPRAVGLPVQERVPGE